MFFTRSCELGVNNDHIRLPIGHVKTCNNYSYIFELLSVHLFVNAANNDQI